MARRQIDLAALHWLHQGAIRGGDHKDVMATMDFKQVRNIQLLAINGFVDLASKFKIQKRKWVANCHPSRNYDIAWRFGQYYWSS
jgi:hypothetical protein